jgi:hypothetical protein
VATGVGKECGLSFDFSKLNDPPSPAPESAAPPG